MKKANGWMMKRRELMTYGAAAAAGLAMPSGRAAAAATPTLIVSTTINYSEIYTDKESGSDSDVSIWRPRPSDGFFILGDYAHGAYGEPTGHAFVVKAGDDDPARPLLKQPIGYTLVWTDKGSGGRDDGSIWAPRAPDGYVALGYVAEPKYSTPWVESYRCVRFDHVTATNAGARIWSDAGSGADTDVAIYQVVGLPGAFVAQANYTAFAGATYRLKNA